MELIDKDKVVKEIERLRTYYEKLQMIKQVYNGHIDNCNDLLDFLDTLEVKEVDLEKEVRKFIKDNGTSLEEPDEFLTTLMLLDDMVMFAKHFYELGLKAKGE